jgi:hypothetical protein
VLAGATWSLFAFKPNWIVAVLWIPAIVGRRRVYLGLAAGAALFVLLTLPFCGVEAWTDWLAAARRTHALDAVAPHWIALRRDLPAIFHRLMRLMRFAPAGGGGAVGWVAIGLMLAVTAAVCRADREAADLPLAGSRAVALLCAAILSCPRFMFYDATLGVLPFLFALGAWSTLGRFSRVALSGLVALFWLGTGIGALAWKMEGPPVETLALAGLWSWAVGQTLHGRRRPSAARAVGPVA